MKSLFRKLFFKVMNRRSSGFRNKGSATNVPIRLSQDLSTNISDLQNILPPNSDIVFRKFTIRGHERIQAILIYIDGLTNKQIIDTQVLRTLMLQSRQAGQTERLTRRNAFSVARDAIITAADVNEIDDFDEVVTQILSGTSILILDGTPTALAIDAQKWEQRGVQQPESQSIVRGPRDGFSESLRTNIVLVRRRIRDPNLNFEMQRLGRRSKTDIAIGYITGVTNPKIIEEVKERLNTIDIDAILESGYVEQLIEDNWWTVFPTAQESERPDQVVGALLGGRVAIMVDNTPFALLVPATVPMFLASSEDLYFRWPAATLLRMLRYAATFASLVLPSLYVALTSYHPGMIPTDLAISIGAAREGVPFPAFIEALAMEITLEVLREAGIRLPAPIGQTIGIVGAIIIGEAAVRAGLVSPVMVIVVAATAIASFVIPTYGFSMAIRISRFGLLFLAATTGLFGIVFGLLAILGHMSILKSFGVPYLAPFAPVSMGDWKDTWVRLPLMSFHRRPSFLKPVDADRLDDKRNQDATEEE